MLELFHELELKFTPSQKRAMNKLPRARILMSPAQLLLLREMERPAMGSLTTMLLAILAIYASSLPYTEAQCPVLTGISPPSGGPMFDYYISGSNLDQVANVTSSSVSSLNVTMINSTSIRFNFLGSASGSITITLAPVQSGCNQVSDTIFLVLSGEWNRHACRCRA